MILRPATEADVAALFAMQQAYDTTWFGAPEQSEAEVRENLGLAESTVVLVDADAIIGYAAVWRAGTVLVADPNADLDVVYPRLVEWMQNNDAAEIEALDRDEALLSLLRHRGWRQAWSSYDLLRPVPDDGLVPGPNWPEGVRERPYRAEDGPALYRLIYDDAAWADVEGHHPREYDDWYSIFIADRRDAEMPVLAWRGDDLVGAAVIRHFDDGTGWIAQLAVATSARRLGLGGALLRAAYRHLIIDGATTLGLAVITSNRKALDLYLSVGLQIEREWQAWVPPGRRVGPAESAAGTARRQPVS